MPTIIPRYRPLVLGLSLGIFCLVTVAYVIDQKFIEKIHYYDQMTALALEQNAEISIAAGILSTMTEAMTTETQNAKRARLKQAIAVIGDRQIRMLETPFPVGAWPVSNPGVEAKIRRQVNRSQLAVAQFRQDVTRIALLPGATTFWSLDAFELIQRTNIELLPELTKAHRYLLTGRADLRNRMILWEQGSVVLLMLVICINGILLIAPAWSRTLRQARELQAAEEAVTRLTNLDPISGLPNANALEQYLVRLGTDTPFMALILDIRASNTLSPESAGAVNLGLFLAVVKSLPGLDLPSDICVHYRNDRVLLIFAEITRPVEAEAMFRRIEALANTPVDLRDYRIRVALSAGVAFRKRGRSASLTVANAEIAAEQAIAEARDLALYTPAMKRRHLDSRKLIRDLREGIKRGELVAYFQPQVCLTDNEVRGFEALVRWNHPTRGLLAPGQFLGLAESSGLDEPLGELMLTQALEALVVWGRAGHFISDVSVNMSRASLQSPTLPDRIKWELDRLGLMTQQLRVEVLENIQIDSDEDRLVRTIQQIAASGVQIDMDDFGTGSTSITGLRRLAANRVKIDRSFIRDIDTHPGNRELVKTVVSMARSLRIEVLAEGVETEQELATVSRLGCKLVQGYHFAKPMSLKDSIAWLDARAEAPKFATAARARSAGRSA